MKKLPEIETLTNILWICFGLGAGYGYYLKENYWISGVCFLLGLLYGYKLFKSQREKWRNRSK